VIVLDASAALAALFNDGPARHALSTESLHVPHLIDSEICGGVRRQVLSGSLSPQVGWRLLETWGQLGVSRHPALPLLSRMWELRNNLSSHDAGYVALAESLGCGLLTADARLAGASRVRCSVTVVSQ
jgi:predicted nucleic acid-binding protein